MGKKNDERKPEQGPGPAPEGPQKIARRRLLEMAAYTAPAVIGSLLISQDAYAQPISCNPPRPCNPPKPCDPHGSLQQPLSPTSSPASRPASSPSQRNRRTRR